MYCLFIFTCKYYVNFKIVKGLILVLIGHSMFGEQHRIPKPVVLY